MTEDERLSELIYELRLGKYPEHRVEGTAVTPEQAEEIILRCLPYHLFFTNDRGFTVAAQLALDIEPEQHSRPDTAMAHFYSVGHYRERVRSLELEYLTLGAQIASAALGGPDGWIRWDGSIGHRRPRSVGKTPKVSELAAEWSAIAEAFPFLELRSQFFADHGMWEADLMPGVEFQIKDGTVVQVDPGPPIKTEPGNELLEIFEVAVQAKSGVMKREYGTTIDELNAAYLRVLERMK